MSPIPQISLLVGTFFVVSYSKTALHIPCQCPPQTHIKKQWKYGRLLLIFFSSLLVFLSFRVENAESYSKDKMLPSLSVICC